MTAVALRAEPRHPVRTPAPRRHVPTAPIPLQVERLLYMCGVAREREQRGEPGDAFHGFCRGRATNPARALGRLPADDGRFQAGRHLCTCTCHDAADAERPSGRP